MLLGGGPAPYGPGGTAFGLGLTCPGAVVLFPSFFYLYRVFKGNRGGAPARL